MHGGGRKVTVTRFNKVRIKIENKGKEKTTHHHSTKFIGSSSSRILDRDRDISSGHARIKVQKRDQDHVTSPPSPSSSLGTFPPEEKN